VSWTCPLAFVSEMTLVKLAHVGSMAVGTPAQERQVMIAPAGCMLTPVPSRVPVAVS
jgi:hypothetical protein